MFWRKISCCHLRSANGSCDGGSALIPMWTAIWLYVSWSSLNRPHVSLPKSLPWYLLCSVSSIVNCFRLVSCHRIGHSIHYYWTSHTFIQITLQSTQQYWKCLATIISVKRRDRIHSNKTQSLRRYSNHSSLPKSLRFETLSLHTLIPRPSLSPSTPPDISGHLASANSRQWHRIRSTRWGWPRPWWPGPVQRMHSPLSVIQAPNSRYGGTGTLHHLKWDSYHGSRGRRCCQCRRRNDGTHCSGNIVYFHYSRKA